MSISSSNQHIFKPENTIKIH